MRIRVGPIAAGDLTFESPWITAPIEADARPLAMVLKNRLHAIRRLF